MPMKIINITLPLLMPLFFWGCTGVQDYGYQKKEFVRPTKPKAAVERAWLARNKYDHERRMLIPMVGGSRWGAIQEYKEDGTLEYKEWWVRDIKKEDLEASPSTALRIIKEQNNDQGTSLNRINLGNLPAPSPVQSNEVLESPNENTTENPTDVDFPPVPSESPIDASPFAPLPFDAVPTLPSEESIAPAPFAPLPNGLPPLGPLEESTDAPQPDPFG
jgi:hypothetical protein